MTSEYSIKHLSAERVVQAYPLARDILGCSSVDDWAAFAEPLTRPASSNHPEQGIIVIERNTYIRGLFSYLVRQGLNGNRVLDVQNFTVLEMAGGERVTDELIKGAERIARRLRCNSLFLTVPKKSNWTIRQLEDRGHTIESFCFSGRVATENGTAS